MRSEIIEYIYLLLIVVFAIDVEAQLLLNCLWASVVNWVVALANGVVDLSCDLVIQLRDFSKVAVHL